MSCRRIVDRRLLSGCWLGRSVVPDRVGRGSWGWLYDWYGMPGYDPGNVGFLKNVCFWSSGAIPTASMWSPAGFCWLFPVNRTWGIWYDTGGGEHWIRWSAGDGGFAVVFSPSAGFTDGTIVGGGPVDDAVTSTETGSSRGCSPDHFSSVASG